MYAYGFSKYRNVDELWSKDKASWDDRANYSKPQILILHVFEGLANSLSL